MTGFKDKDINTEINTSANIDLGIVNMVRE